MSIELNHTIVHAEDKEVSARFLADTLGLPPPEPFGHFLVVRTSNGVSLDFMTTAGQVSRQHYAFLVSDTEFDEIFVRLRERGISYWADPQCQRANEINRHYGGSGVYFREPSGHLLEILTQPYGSAG